MTQDDNDKQKLIRVIVCRPGEHAKTRAIEDKLEMMQWLVGGPIEEYMPFDGDDPREEDIAIICNEEGKLRGLPLNRSVKDKDGHVQDIIVGTFFICYAPLESESFESLPPDLEEKYLKKFEHPEHFFRTEKGIVSIHYEPDILMPEPEMGR